jgi:hypothetical protein
MDRQPQSVNRTQVAGIPVYGEIVPVTSQLALDHRPLVIEQPAEVRGSTRVGRPRRSNPVASPRIAHRRTVTDAAPVGD